MSTQASSTVNEPVAVNTTGAAEIVPPPFAAPPALMIAPQVDLMDAEAYLMKIENEIAATNVSLLNSWLDASKDMLLQYQQDTRNSSHALLRGAIGQFGCSLLGAGSFFATTLGSHVGDGPRINREYKEAADLTKNLKTLKENLNPRTPILQGGNPPPIPGDNNPFTPCNRIKDYLQETPPNFDEVARYIGAEPHNFTSNAIKDAATLIGNGDLPTIKTRLNQHIKSATLDENNKSNELDRYNQKWQNFSQLGSTLFNAAGGFSGAIGQSNSKGYEADGIGDKGAEDMADHGVDAVRGFIQNCYQHLRDAVSAYGQAASQAMRG